MYHKFLRAVSCVGSNNHLNGGKWSDWQSGYDILETYGISCDQELAALLDQVIASDEPNKLSDKILDELCKNEYGIIFGDHLDHDL